MGALSAYLEQMAEKGWFPDKIGEWGIVFYEEEPEERRYAAAFVPGGSFMTCLLYTSPSPRDRG